MQEDGNWEKRGSPFWFRTRLARDREAAASRFGPGSRPDSGKGPDFRTLQFTATEGSTIIPAVTRCRPFTITRSPLLMPSRITRLPFSTGPSFTLR